MIFLEATGVMIDSKIPSNIVIIGLNLASIMDLLNTSVILLSTESHLAVGLKKKPIKLLRFLIFQEFPCNKI